VREGFGLGLCLSAERPYVWAPRRNDETLSNRLRWRGASACGPDIPVLNPRVGSAYGWATGAAGDRKQNGTAAALS